MPYSWAKSSVNGFEVSSAGDARFSAFTARIDEPDDDYPWTIEIFYQVAIKGYIREAVESKLPFHLWWKVGKGKPFKSKSRQKEAYKLYLDLWREWANLHPELLAELAILAEGKILTDKFASTHVNQAHALSDLLNEKYGSGIEHLKNKE